MLFWDQNLRCVHADEINCPLLHGTIKTSCIPVILPVILSNLTLAMQSLKKHVQHLSLFSRLFQYDWYVRQILITILSMHTWYNYTTVRLFNGTTKYRYNFTSVCATIPLYHIKCIRHCYYIFILKPPVKKWNFDFFQKS